LGVVDRMGSRAPAARLAELHHPASLSEVGREVRHHGTVVGPDRRRERARGVDHEDVARIEELRQVGGPCVGQRAVGAAGDEHAHVVAAPTFGLDRVVGDELGRHVEVEHPRGEGDGRHHATSSGWRTSATR
jgi:hypothetical protein